MPAAGVVMIIAVVVIVAALVYLPRRDDPRPAEDHRGPRRRDRGGGRDHREERAGRRGGPDDQPDARRRGRPARGPAGQEGGHADAVGLVEGLYPGAAAAGFATSRQRDHQGPADLRGLHEGDADPGPARPRGADRRRQPNGPALRNAGLRQRRGGRSTPTAARPASCAAALAGHRRRLAGSVRGPARDGRRPAPPASPAATAPARAKRELRAVQTPAPFEYERATSVQGAIAALPEHGSEARIIAGGHSLLPMMKLRLANPAT